MKQLLECIPVCRRTLDNWKAAGVLPCIKIGRRCLYDWEHVRAALLRNERGGQHSYRNCGRDGDFEGTSVKLAARAIKEGWLVKNGREYALVD